MGYDIAENHPVTSGPEAMADEDEEESSKEEQDLMIDKDEEDIAALPTKMDIDPSDDEDRRPSKRPRGYTTN